MYSLFKRLKYSSCNSHRTFYSRNLLLARVILRTANVYENRSIGPIDVFAIINRSLVILSICKIVRSFYRTVRDLIYSHLRVFSIYGKCVDDFCTLWIIQTAIKTSYFLLLGRKNRVALLCCLQRSRGNLGCSHRKRLWREHYRQKG